MTARTFAPVANPMPVPSDPSDGAGGGGDGSRRGRTAATLVVAVTALLGAVAAFAVHVVFPGRPKGQPKVALEAPATAMYQAVGPANNSPEVLADPADPRFVVLANRLDGPDYGCSLQVSGNGGRDWLPARPVPSLPAGAEKCYAPEVAFDRNGALHYLFVGLAGKGNKPMGVFLTSSADHAQTFTTPRQVLGPDRFGVRLALDPSVGTKGRIHMVWLEARDVGGSGFTQPNLVLTAHSDDGGRTFSEPVRVSDVGRARIVAPAVALGPKGSVHVAYYDLGADARDYQGLEGPVWDEPWSIVVASSSDRGGRFAPGVVVDDEVRTARRVMVVFTMPPPSLVAGPGKRVCAAWTDARHGDDDAMARCSRDGGQTWDSLARLNDDPVNNGSRQYLPSLAVAPGGRLDAVFLDRRDDSSNTRYHTYFTHSDDDGRTFARNIRLTTYSSDSRRGQQYALQSAEGQVESGGRLGLLSRPDGALAAWPDTRNSVMGARTSQDVFTTLIDLPRRDSRSSLAAMLGLGSLGGALAGSCAVLVRRARRRRAAQP